VSEAASTVGESVERAILDSRLVAIVRGVAPETTLKIAEALFEGGVRVLETPFGAEVSAWSATAATIAALKRRFGERLCVGAGTVLADEQLSLAAAAGAQFMVSPVFDAWLCAAAGERGLAVLPGAMTPGEIHAAAAVSRLVKLFPAGVLTPAYVRQVLTPMPHLKLVATGGITLDNAADFLAAGCAAVAVSSPFTDPKLLSAGDYSLLTARAAEFVRRCLNACR